MRSEEKKSLFLITNLIFYPTPQHSSNLFFNQDVDPLEHPFTAKLIGKVGLNLKCICKKYNYTYILEKLQFCINQADLPLYFYCALKEIGRFETLFRRYLRSD